ncbi:MAG TPA: hypothetical protein VGR72_13270 [Candidatus Acidoferrales bacterium]|nr:hypothetical protein [Candidatus Acidoferrales bacterium]
MGILRCVRSVIILAGVLILMGAVPAVAQETSQASPGTKYGDYNVQQTAEVGFRYVNMGGNMANYDTFENLNSGARLLDYTLDVTSPDHKGKPFDNISLYNFGYGGDPNDLTHLRIAKSRIYEFTGQFRRDNNFFAYNLLANPLNPSNFSPAPVPITFAPHDLDLVHRMTDLNLTLMPQSRMSLRLGYFRNVSEGPSYSSLDGGTEPQLFQNWKTTVNSYRMGADFKFLPRTTFSYDQYLDYSKYDTSWVDRNFSNYQLGNGTLTSQGTPVDLGIVYTGTSPCANSIVPPSAPPPNVPPVASPTCNAFLDATNLGASGYPVQAPGYSRAARPRTGFPTELLSFQSSYFHNFDMAGQFGYSSSENTVTGLEELFAGNVTRTLEQAYTTAGPGDAKRFTVTGNWSGTYSITPKLSVSDDFRYDNWRIPGAWNFLQTAAFAQETPPSMLAPPGTFTAANCNAGNNYAGAGCPIHNASSSADSAAGTRIRFFKQFMTGNTTSVRYDFSRRLGLRLGYEYGYRTLYDQNTIIYTSEVFFPGAGAAGNGAAIADRGDCALVSGSLPAGCTAQPDGSVIFTGPTVGSDTAPGLMAKIHSHSGLFGIWALPTDSLRLSFDAQLFSADQVFTRITPRQSQHYRVHATYVLQNWATIDGSLNISESRDNVQFVNYLAHNRSASFVATLMPHEKYSFDLGYSYNNVFSQALICYNYGFSPTLPPGGIGIPCTLPSGPGDINDTTSSDFDRWQTNGFYKDAVHYPYFDFMWKPLKRITSSLGYAATFARGSAPFLNPLQPSGTLSYTYQKPYASVAFDAGGGISYKAAWTYYGYNPRGIQIPTISGTSTSLAVPAIGFNGFLQDFNGNTVMFSLRYTH